MLIVRKGDSAEQSTSSATCSQAVSPMIMIMIMGVRISSDSGTRTVLLCDFHMGRSEVPLRPSGRLMRVRVRSESRPRARLTRKVPLGRFSSFIEILISEGTLGVSPVSNLKEYVLSSDRTQCHVRSSLNIAFSTLHAQHSKIISFDNGKPAAESP